jgi:hypothetical protein
VISTHDKNKTTTFIRGTGFNYKSGLYSLIVSSKLLNLVNSNSLPKAHSASTEFVRPQIRLLGDTPKTPSTKKKKTEVTTIDQRREPTGDKRQTLDRFLQLDTITTGDS